MISFGKRWRSHRLLWVWISVGILTGAITWLVSAKPSQAACAFFAEPQRFNTHKEGDVVVIGRQPDSPYRVVVLSEDRDTLSEIRACVLDAFATRSRVGPYIQVGSFNRRGDAEVIRRVLRRSGYQARVTYVRD